MQCEVHLNHMHISVYSIYITILYLSSIICSLNEMKLIQQTYILCSTTLLRTYHGVWHPTYRRAVGGARHGWWVSVGGWSSWREHQCPVPAQPPSHSGKEAAGHDRYFHLTGYDGVIDDGWEAALVGISGHAVAIRGGGITGWDSANFILLKDRIWNQALCGCLGFIYNRGTDTKWGLKMHTSNGEVEIYKNKLKWRMCKRVQKLWCMLTNIL